MKRNLLEGEFIIHVIPEVDWDEQMRQAESLSLRAMCDEYWIQLQSDGWVRLDGRFNREQLAAIAEKLPRKEE